MATNDAQTTPNSDAGGSHAIVIGASMAGLLAARVLTDHFDRVTIIDNLRTGRRENLKSALAGDATLLSARAMQRRADLRGRKLRMRRNCLE